MSERPTPRTDAAAGDLTGIELCAAFEAQSRRLELLYIDLERQLAERDAQIAGFEKRLSSSERARRALSDAADHLSGRLRETQGQLEVARTALKRIGWVNGSGIPKHSREADVARAALARIDAKPQPISA